MRLTTPGAPPLPDGLPPFAPEFVLTRAGAIAGQGRAGMLYRDLIPGRLGGRYIASHITIPDGGPVADWVHYHRVALQMIFVRRGWVRVVYEDQGEPFVMHEGDLVLQPPEIRHRVLESSPGLEVVEISAPALHETFADHELELPNGSEPGAQSSAASASCGMSPPTRPGRRSTAAKRRRPRSWTRRAASRRRGSSGRRTAIPIAFAPHDGELVFGFVLDGSATLEFARLHELGAGRRLRHPAGRAVDA